MALYCLTSPGGSPGVTTTALGLALAWPQKVLLAECDPMGRRVLPGYMADRLRNPAGPGLLGLATAVLADPHASISLEKYAVSIVDDGRVEGRVELLHGVRDPRHAAQLAAAWPLVARALTARDGDVVADLGRIGGAETPIALVEAANAVLVVLKPTLAQVDAVKPRLDALRTVVGKHGTLGLCLVMDGPYSAAEVQRVTKTPVLAELPFSPVEAQVLSDGARPRRTFRTSLLARSLHRLGKQLREAVGESAARKATSALPPPASAPHTQQPTESIESVGDRS